MSILLQRLIDDAAVFPPGDAPLDVAIRDHGAYAQSAYASLVGPLLVRDLDVALLPDLVDGPLEIGVIATSGPSGLDQAIAELHDLPHISVCAVEIPVTGDDLALATKELVAALGSVPDGVTVSVELPRPGPGVTAAWIAAADDIAAAGFQAKFRTGGIAADAYPDEDQLAAVLGALVPRPVKLTAGLHRAVRNTQPGTGFEQHGFLNVMVAVHRLLSGSTVGDAAGVLADRDGHAVAATIQSWSDEDAAAVRHTFRGFGSCSVTEPYDDLVELGLC